MQNAFACTRVSLLFYYIYVILWCQGKRRYVVELISIYNEFLGLISKLTRNVVATGSFWSKWSCYSLLQMNWSNITHDTQVDKQNLRQIENHLLVLLIFQDYSYLYERRLTIREVWYDHGEWGDVQRIKLHILFINWYKGT